MVRRAMGVLLVLFLVAVVPAACGGPRTATLDVTVTDEDGAPLAEITVTAGDKTATTDARGTAALSEITPGTVTVRFSGEGYTAMEQGATVQAGDNTLTCELKRAALVVRDIAAIGNMRLRITAESDGESYQMKADLAANGDCRWVVNGTTVTVKGQVLYVEADGEVIRFDDDLGRTMTEVYLGVSRVYMNEFFELSSDLSAPGAHSGRLAGHEGANGHQCNVYEVTWPGLPEALSYKVWVITSGEWAGYITRYRSEQTGIGSVQIDVWDFDAEIEIQAPV